MDFITAAIARKYTDTRFEELGFDNLTYHFCLSGEYNSSTGVPTVESPDENTMYFTPGDENVFNVYIYNNGWELFTSVELDLSTIPTDDTLAVAGTAADAKAVGDELYDVKSDLNQTIGDLLVEYTKDVYPNPRQLFDKSILPTITGNHLHTNTSTRAITGNTKARVYTVEINGQAGEQYSFNLLNSKTFADYHITSMEIYASDAIPAEGGTALQRGSTSTQYYRGLITLGQASKYIYVDLVSSLSDESTITSECNSLMENTVIRKGTYDTTYYDYEVVVDYETDYKVVKVNQGIANAGKTLMVGDDGNVSPVALPDITEELNDVKDTVDDYLVSFDETHVVNPRQLFDKSILPTITNNQLFTNTSTRVVSSNARGRVYTVEANGEVGDTFSYNLLNSKTFADYHISSMEIYASDAYPAVGATALQRGSSSPSAYRGLITLNQSAKYIYVNIYVTSDLADETAITNACNGAMENVVLRKGSYDTTYYEYSEDVISEANYKVVEKNQGLSNAGKMLIVGADGNVTVGTIVDPEVNDGVGYFPLQSVHVGSNMITSGTAVNLGTNWSGDITNGLTHTSGASGSATITLPTTSGKRYLMMFTVSNESENSLLVAFGDGSNVDTYNGTNSIAIGFVSDGVATITLSAVSSLSVTVSDISVYEVTDSGTEIVLDAKNVNHGNTASCISGFWNVALGYQAQKENINGSRNVAIGIQSQYMLKQGTRNVAIGSYSMPFVKEGDRNVAIGSDSLYSASNVNTENKAYDNVAIGKAALHDGANIVGNVAIGSSAMKDGDGYATDNVVIGMAAGNYAHNYNTFVGKRSGYYTKGNHNVALGYESGSQLYVTGTQNVSIGSQAGFDNSGASSSSPKTINNSIAVGFNVKVTDSNQARFGNASQTIILAGKKINFNQDGTVTWETA